MGITLENAIKENLNTILQFIFEGHEIKKEKKNQYTSYLSSIVTTRQSRSTLLAHHSGPN